LIQFLRLWVFYSLN